MFGMGEDNDLDRLLALLDISCVSGMRIFHDGVCCLPNSKFPNRSLHCVLVITFG